MKLKVGNKVYLQRQEIDYIVNEMGSLPGSIIAEIMKNSGYKVVAGANEFLLAFEDPKNVEWLMNQSWILNYEDYANLSVMELELRLSHLKTECAKKTKSYRSKSEAAQKAHWNEYNEWLKKRRHVITSVESLIAFSSSREGFILPEDYVPPKNTSRPSQRL